MRDRSEELECGGPQHFVPHAIEDKISARYFVFLLTHFLEVGFRWRARRFELRE
jgi:hypothetical protein